MLKSASQVLAAVLAAIVPLLTGNHAISASEWINVAIIAVGAIGVYVVPNLDAGVAKYAKLVASGLSAFLVLLVSVISDGVSTSEWLQLALAVLGALGVAGFTAPQFPVVAPPVRPTA